MKREIGKQYMYGQAGHLHLFADGTNKHCYTNHLRYREVKLYVLIMLMTFAFVTYAFYQGTGGF